jgi:hypothetical protein
MNKRNGTDKYLSYGPPADFAVRGLQGVSQAKNPEKGHEKCGAVKNLTFRPFDNGLTLR